MIVSASYKTDIPAFYGQWFRNRLRAGYCKMVNPYNRHQICRVSLLPVDVDGIVFWTKNLAPFFEGLSEVHERGIPFIVQYTINGYPRSLESRVVDANDSVEQFRRLADTYGARHAVWRYDTIVFSSVTPPDFHRQNFERLATSLEKATDEVVISFAQIYKKTLRNMSQAAVQHGFTWEDPSDNNKLSLLHDLTAIAAARGMRIKVCSQKAYLTAEVGEARCVDAQRLMEIAGRRFGAKLQGNRKECGCFYSKDIGDYDTCPHGCVYCYAVMNRELAVERYKQHDPEGEFLFPAPGHADGASSEAQVPQMDLFGAPKK